ncbi:beta-ketoacyl synthase N-terminal-like domain-containing protein [Streptomyces sp. NPDC007346]|uniref:beta-ketoacyl synthase N-terminal-like domain-containing protein n=1 Tax=Streptomyces sp. NPDC007346 TaxID=3154682 RepID=UPI003454103B
MTDTPATDLSVSRSPARGTSVRGAAGAPVGLVGLTVRSAPVPVPRLPRRTEELPRTPLAVRDLLRPALLATAETAVAEAGLSPDEVRTMGCVTASNGATAATGTYIAQVLAGPGPRWLAPECFLHYSPHTLTGELSIALDLDGHAVTLTGAAAGVDALGYAALMVRSGRCRSVLVAAAHWPRPATPDDESVPLLTTAAAILGSGGGGGGGSVNSWGGVTGWRPGGSHPAVRGDDPAGSTDGRGADVTAPFAALARWRASRGTRGMELAGGGSRLAVVAGGGA